VGSSGVFGQTFDDVTWSFGVVAPRDLASVACLGELDGWVAGSHGEVLHTPDGGRTWSAQSSGASADLHAVRFGGLGFGVAAGDGGMVLITHDAGAHWTPAPALVTSALRGVAIAGGSALVVGDGAVVLRSADSGASWSASAIAAASDLRGVAMDPAGHVLLAVDSAGRVWRSEDRGVGFALDAALGSPLDAVSIADDGSRAVTVGAAGAIYVRDELGTWHPSFSPTTADLHAGLVTGGVWYAVGDAGTLLSSHDRGVTWRWLATGTKATLRGLDDL
jgi:photosystem II stability/assembly factor-like uncharacterized protein